MIIYIFITIILLQVNDNQRFKEHIKTLREINKFSMKAISERLGMNYFKLRNITIDRSSANSADLDRLINAFPELSLTSKEDKIKKQIENLHIENQQLKQQLFETIKEKDLKQETIDKLLEIIKNHK